MRKARSGPREHATSCGGGMGGAVPPGRLSTVGTYARDSDASLQQGDRWDFENKVYCQTLPDKRYFPYATRRYNLAMLTHANGLPS